ncbi:jg12900, partial [Pararge aegeria aegeria]
MSDLDKSEQLAAPKRYFSVHYLLLRFLGLGWWHHPDEGDTHNFPGLYIYYVIITEVVWVAGFVGLETIDPFVGQKDIDRFMFSLSFVITHDLTLIKLYIFFFKNNEIQDIVHTLEIGLQSFYQNNEKIRQTIRITRILTATFLIFGWITIGNSNVYGIVQDIVWKTEVAKLNDTSFKPPRTLPQPIYIPWNYQSDKSYISTFLLETVGLLWTGHIVMTIDTFIGSVILHMSSQFEILQEAIITVYERTIEHLTKVIKCDNDDIDMIDDSHNTDIECCYERIVRTYCTEQEIENALENTLKSCLRQHQSLI